MNTVFKIKKTTSSAVLSLLLGTTAFSADTADTIDPRITAGHISKINTKFESQMGLTLSQQEARQAAQDMFINCTPDYAIKSKILDARERAIQAANYAVQQEAAEKAARLTNAAGTHEPIVLTPQEEARQLQTALSEVDYALEQQQMQDQIQTQTQAQKAEEIARQFTEAFNENIAKQEQINLDRALALSLQEQQEREAAAAKKEQEELDRTMALSLQEAFEKEQAEEIARQFTDAFNANVLKSNDQDELANAISLSLETPSAKLNKKGIPSNQLVIGGRAFDFDDEFKSQLFNFINNQPVLMDYIFSNINVVDKDNKNPILAKLIATDAKKKEEILRQIIENLPNLTAQMNDTQKKNIDLILENILKDKQSSLDLSLQTYSAKLDNQGDKNNQLIIGDWILNFDAKFKDQAFKFIINNKDLKDLLFSNVTLFDKISKKPILATKYIATNAKKEAEILQSIIDNLPALLDQMNAIQKKNVKLLLENIVKHDRIEDVKEKEVKLVEVNELNNAISLSLETPSAFLNNLFPHRIGSSKLHVFNPGAPKVNVLKTDAPKLHVFNPEAPKVNVLKTDAPKLHVFNPEAPKVNVLKTDAPKLHVFNPEAPKVNVLKTDAPKLHVFNPEAPKVNVLKTDAPKLHVFNPEAPKVNVLKTDASKLHVFNPEAPKVNVLKTDASKLHVFNPEAPKVNVLKTDAPKLHVFNPEAPKVNVLKTDAPKLHVFNPEAPKVNVLKTDAPKLHVFNPEAPKVNVLKTDVPKVKGHEGTQLVVGGQPIIFDQKAKDQMFNFVINNDDLKKLILSKVSFFDEITNQFVPAKSMVINSKTQQEAIRKIIDLFAAMDEKQRNEELTKFLEERRQPELILDAPKREIPERKKLSPIVKKRSQEDFPITRKFLKKLNINLKNKSTKK